MDAEEEEDQIEISLAPLKHIIKVNNISVIESHSHFVLESLLYKHREAVYRGVLSLKGVWTDVIVKKYSINTRDELSHVVNELDIMMTLDKAKYRLKLFGVFTDANDNYFYTFFKSLKNNITSLLPKFTSLQKLIVLRNLLKFMLDFHSLGIIHRDIKLDIFWLDETLNVYIFDFSNSVKTDNLLLGTKPFITPKYVAPELTCCEARFGWAQDIWSLGCSLINLFLDHEKYEQGTIEMLLTKIFQTEKTVPKIPKDVEHNIAMIVSNCFFIEPLNRCDILNLIEKFNKFFKKNNFEAIDVKDLEKSNFIKLRETTKNCYMKEYYEIMRRQDEVNIDFCEYHQGKLSKLYNLNS